MARKISPVWRLVTLLGVAGLGPCSRAVACSEAGDEVVQIAAVEPRLELRLADGRLVRLAGLDPPLQTPSDPDLGETARMRLAGLLDGKAATLQLLSGAPDRWGRLAARVFVGDGAPGGVATAAVAAGLGRYFAEPAARECRDALLTAEDKARVAKLGLWADPYYAILSVDDRAAFNERSGTIVLVEGRLTAVQPGPYRTTLRFAAPKPSGLGSFGGHMLVATILPRTMKTFEAQKMDVRALIGQRVRLRGLLDQRFGPRIELAGPDQVEPLDQIRPFDQAEPLKGPATLTPNLSK